MALSDVIGQDKAIAALRHALRTGRIASSYLFAGDSGIGKKFTAVNFAKALNCQGGATSPCEQAMSPSSQAEAVPCSSCRKIDAGVHPDVFIIRPEKSLIKVDEIRQIESALSLRPYEGDTKVVIVDDAETMNLSASNAFLKTLEEPPPHSTIILISSQPDSLLETIRSRCMRINFKPLSMENCKTVLEGAASLRHGLQAKGTASQDNIPGGSVPLCMGRPGIAMEDDLIKERDRFLRLLEEITIPGSKTQWKDRTDIEKWLDTAFIVLRDMAVFKITGQGNMLINKDIEAVIRQMCNKMDLKVIIECYERLQDVRNYLRFNLNKAITWSYIGGLLGSATPP